MTAGLGLPAAQAHAAEILKLGFVTSLSDAAASRGQDFVDGFKLGLKNLGGRLGGIEVDLVTADDQSRPDTAAQAARRLIEREHVHLLSGSVTRETAMAVAEAVKGDTGPLFVSPAFGPEELAGADCRMGFFSLVPPSDQFVEAMARHLKGEAEQPILAVAISKDQPQAASQADLLRQTFPDLTLLETGKGELTFARQLQALRASRAEALAVFLDGGIGVGFLRQLYARDMRGDKNVLVDWPLLEPTHLQALGEAAIGLRAVAPWADDPENPVSHKFLADYEDENRALPSSFAALGYDLAMVLDQAVRNMNGRVAERTAFARALAAVQVQGTRGHIRFANNHFAAAPLVLKEGWRDARSRLTTLRKAVLASQADRHAAACRLSAPEPPPEETAPAKKKR